MKSFPTVAFWDSPRTHLGIVSVCSKEGSKEPVHRALWRERTCWCPDFPEMILYLRQTSELFIAWMITMVAPDVYGIFKHFKWFPWWLRQQRICLQCRRPGSIPWVGKIPWRRKWLPTPVFLPGEFHGQRSLVGCSPWDNKELDTTEQLTLSNDHRFLKTYYRKTGAA